ncbi:MAG TPA: sterol desaturase family protein [Bacteroidia bacterium]
MLVGFLTVIITFIVMEGVTWLTHKYVMHGFLWVLHDDHHNKNKENFFEKNDSFFVIFAGLSMIFYAIGTLHENLGFMFFIGLGITLYGIAYFFVHDIFIHQRFRWFTRTDNFYLRAIRKAHKVHHKHLGREHGECFGMLWVPVKYFWEALQNQKQHG